MNNRKPQAKKPSATKKPAAKAGKSAAKSTPAKKPSAKANKPSKASKAAKATAKPAVKKTAVKKAVAKKVVKKVAAKPTKKVVAKAVVKAPVKKAVVKVAAKKAAPVKAVAKKVVAPKVVAKKVAPAKVVVPKAAPAPKAKAKAKPKTRKPAARPLSARDQEAVTALYFEPTPAPVTESIPVVNEPLPQSIEVACRILYKLRAEKVQLLDLRGHSDIADYFVVGTCASEAQMQAILGALQREFKTLHLDNMGVEYKEGVRWAVFDGIEMMVHLFEEKARDEYSLDRLWRDGKEITVSADQFQDAQSGDTSDEELV